MKKVKIQATSKDLNGTVSDILTEMLQTLACCTVAPLPSFGLWLLCEISV